VTANGLKWPQTTNESGSNCAERAVVPTSFVTRNLAGHSRINYHGPQRHILNGRADGTSKPLHILNMKNHHSSPVFIIQRQRASTSH